MPKIVFDRTNTHLRVLPGANRVEHAFHTESSSVDVKYKLDNGTSLYLWLNIQDQWLDGADIDELIEFLKAVKENEASV